MAFSLEDYHNSGDTATIFSIYGANWHAMTFTASDNYDATRLKIKVYRTGSPGTVTVSLRACIVETYPRPTGGDLASGTFDGDSISSSSPGEWVTIDLSGPVSLTSGTVYAIVIRAPSGSAANYMNWRHTNGNVYANGGHATSTNSGSSWTANSTSYNQDLMFEVYSGAAANYVDMAASGTITFSGNADLTLSVIVSGLEADENRMLVCFGNDELWFEDL